MLIVMQTCRKIIQTKKVCIYVFILAEWWTDDVLVHEYVQKFLVATYFEFKWDQKFLFFKGKHKNVVLYCFVSV